MSDAVGGRQFTLDSVGTFATKGAILVVAFGADVILTRALGAERKGVYYIFIVVFGVTKLILGCGLGPANVFFGSKEPAKLKRLVGNSILAAGILGTLSWAMLSWVASIEPAAKYLTNSGVNLSLFRWLGLSLPLLLMWTYGREILRSQGLIGYYNGLQLLEVATRLSLLIVALEVISGGVFGALTAWLGGISAATLGTWIITCRLTEGQASMSMKTGKEQLLYGLKIVPGRLAQFLNYRLDVLILGALATPTQIGLYVTATGICEKLWEIPKTIRTVLFHRIPRMKEGSAAEKSALLVRLTGLLLAGACVVLGIVATPALKLIYGAEFSGAAIAIYALLPGVWAMGMTNIAVTYLSGRGHPEAGAISSIFALTITIVLDIVLIPRWGILGAAAASSTAYIVATAIVFRWFVEHSRMSVAEVLIPGNKDWNAVREIACILQRYIRDILARSHA